MSLAIVAALVGYAFDGWFARYTADDYCTAGAERAFGFLGAQAYWYQNWSGRYAYFAIVGLVEFAGDRIVQLLPALALAAWLGSGTWAVLPIARQQRWPLPVLSATALSGALSLVCLQGAPDIDQALYWQTGMLTYLLPLVLLTVYAGWIVRRGQSATARGPSPAELAAGAAPMFVAGGISETTLSLQLALLGLASVLSLGWLRSRRRSRVPIILASGLAATLLAAVIVVAAPGNAIREARATGSVQGWSHLPVALQAGIDFVGLFARAVQFRARSAVLILGFLSLSCGFSSVFASIASASRRGLWGNVAAAVGAVACGWVLLMAATVPGFFAQQWDPPERAQFVAAWAAAVSLPVAAYLLGRALAHLVWLVGIRPPAHRWLGPIWASCLVVLAAGPALMLATTLARVPDDATYAAAWDALDGIIRERARPGEALVLDRSLPAHFGFDFIGADPGSYPNPCVAQFYGIPSIRSVQ